MYTIKDLSEGMIYFVLIATIILLLYCLLALVANRKDDHYPWILYSLCFGALLMLEIFSIIIK